MVDTTGGIPKDEKMKFQSTSAQSWQLKGELGLPAGALFSTVVVESPLHITVDYLISEGA